MAVTIVDRPFGLTLEATSKQATVSSSSGDVIFTKTAHTLSTGNYVYIISNIRDYAGFWYVTRVDANRFKISKYATASFVQYIVDDTVTYYMGLDGSWNSVHLPIVYKLSSDLWPVNSVDTVRTVSTSANAFGYTRLTLSGDIKATGSANELDFVKLTVNGTEGIYQILQWTSDTNIVVDLTFVGSNTYGNIQFYYNNYHVRVKIYAGLKSNHRWAAQKPYVYITELKEVPDSDNLVMININEYLKSQINILSNDLLLATLPNDINSFCQFYISVAESYDISLDGYTIGSYLSSYADDSPNFEWIAVNSKLPFKNIHSGYMSDYMGANRKFLTMFAQPTMFNGFWFEIGFLYGTNETPPFLALVQQTYKSGVLQASYETFIDASNNQGVFRLQLSVKGTEDQQKVFLSDPAGSPYTTKYSEVKTINVNNDCAAQSIQFQWKNYTGGYDQFVFTAQNDNGIDIPATKQSQKSIMGNWPDSYGSNADTINREIERNSNGSITVYSQYLSEIECDGIAFIKSSTLVQILVSKFDKRTVIIDTASWVKKTDGAKTFSITFKASFTDDIPSQSL